ncbi:MAG: hypothetical protein GY926_25685 [bacterium]|nr:hypothetical protein [bacterium]
MTITSSSITALLTFSVVFAVVFISVTLWRRRVPSLLLGSSLRAAVYLTRYAVALEYYGLRRAEIKSHVEALRGDLGAVDPTDIGATLQRLGPPRTLAAEMTIETLRPSFLRGAVWFGVAVLIALATSIFTTEAFLGGFEAVAQPGEKASWSGIGLDVEATMGSNGHASTIGFGGYGPLVLPVFAFIVGARLWRLRSRPRSESHTMPA